MSNVLTSKIKELITKFRIWILYHNYAKTAARNLQEEITETIDETFAENVEVMRIFKERLVRLYNNDKRN